MDDTLVSGLAQSDEKILHLQRDMRRMRLAMESCAEQQQSVSRVLAGLLADHPPINAVMTYLEARLLHNLERVNMAAEEAILDAKLLDLMDTFGIAALCEIHVPFDPERHEVCDVRTEMQYPDTTVLSIVRPGFMLHGAVVRPALVVIKWSRVRELLKVIPKKWRRAAKDVVLERWKKRKCHDRTFKNIYGLLKHI